MQPKNSTSQTPLDIETFTENAKQPKPDKIKKHRNGNWYYCPFCGAQKYITTSEHNRKPPVCPECKSPIMIPLDE